ncbi:MAG: AmmeMemoRadiSam system radical SAM enzyme [Candidatus Zixiibacteriota bacterium]
MRKQARYYIKLENDKIRCNLCPHRCKIPEGKRGICYSRFVEDGSLFTDNYGEIIALNIDPIEKKPLYHFHPGKDILSTGPNGCNFSCKFCQNWQISRQKSKTKYLPPEELVKLSLDTLGIAYTYTEPTIWFEYMLDVAKMAKDKGQKNVMITNGFIQPEPFDELLDYIDAINIDLKSFDEDFYRKFCGGRRKPVLESIRQANEKAHVEITNLVITDLNDSRDNFIKMIDFIADVDDNIPFHISRYYPAYELKNEATAVETIREFVDLARERLNYVYAGNVQIDIGNDTKCPNCGNLLIKRTGYSTTAPGIKDGKCNECEREFDGKI